MKKNIAEAPPGTYDVKLIPHKIIIKDPLNLQLMQSFEVVSGDYEGTVIILSNKEIS